MNELNGLFPNHTTIMKKGFTLIETLTSIGIITVLSAITAAGVGKMKSKAQQAVEVSTARDLMIAYMSAGNDNTGKLIPGVITSSEGQGYSPQYAKSPHEKTYPWRLSDYIGDPIRTYFPGKYGKDINRSSANYESLVSQRPYLGMNVTFVGGDYGPGSLLKPTDENIERYGRFVLTDSAQANAPESLIVFASARGGSGKDSIGNAVIYPPKVIGAHWSGSRASQDSLPAAHGNVDFRWDGRALVAMLDGSTALLSEKDLRDMQYWSNQAALARDSDFSLGAN